MSEHREFKHKRREFKHREEESHSPVLDHEEREGGPARGVDGVDTVAGDLALPATISSSIWHEEEERKQGGDVYRRSRGSGVEHDKIRRRKEIDHATMSTARSAEEKDRPSDDDHDLPEDKRSKVHDKHDLPKGRTIIDT